ncbi:Amino acid/polyamine transporter 2 [Sesbania bispinosa]|nr:Amino acid/polyamine transporter 2 [Sesbania bispinosa]
MQQLHLPFPFKHKYLTCPKTNGTVQFLGQRSRTTHLQTSVVSYKTTPLVPFFTCNGPNLPLIKPCNATALPSPSAEDDADTVKNLSPDVISDDNAKGKSFWGAVSLIIGAAVGPGMLGLPALTIKSGQFPSTIIILLSWLYVISSIILVAELCFATMEEDGVEEVTFTSLATKTLGSKFGAFVALVYTSLCFSLLVACVAGIGSIFSPCFPRVNTLIVHSLFPLFVGILMVFFPFKTIDVANRFLCFLMLFSITGLVAIGLSVARVNIISSFASASWNLSSILPIIPVAVLTVGFHVITPFICKIAGNTVQEARKAILIGGTVPLVMVLSWNLIVLGLVGTNTAANTGDPISLLLSVNPSALSAVQGFAFSAMATSLIGYAVSLPKQILDTLELVSGLASNSGGSSVGYSGKLSTPESEMRALDFAGVYANCFLFGIIPPVMAYIHQSKKKIRSSFIPGGNGTLLVLFIISVILGIWH